MSGKIDDHEVGGEVEDLGEHYENLETKEVFCTFNKREQTRGGHKEIYVPIRSRSLALCISFTFFWFVCVCVFLKVFVCACVVVLLCVRV